MPGVHPSTAVVIALGAGVLGGIQPKINAVLGARVGSSLLASVVNFAAAFVVVMVVVMLRPATRQTLRDVRSWPVPRWTLSAGLGGAVVVLAGAAAVETIGVAIFSVAFFAGQITFGLLVDRLGVSPGGVRPLASARVQAAAVAMAAVAVSQLGRPVGTFSPGLVVFVVGAGAGVAFQSAFNGRISLAVGDAFAATSLNVAVGLSALIATVAVVIVTAGLGPVAWPAEPWLYAGGLLGVTIVLCLAVATAAVGVLRTTIAMLAAQLTTAFVVDWVVEGDSPTAGAVAGAALVVVAIGLLGRGRPSPGSTPPSA
jgi:bacterial/archaeal transporter family-2 protein